MADVPGPGPDPDPPVDAGVEAARHGLSDRLARGAGLAGAGFVLTRGLTFLTYLIVANLIAPSDAGQLAAAQVLLAFGFIFAESGMLAALLHWKGNIDEAASTATISTLATGVLLTLFGLATAPLVGTFFDSATIGWVAAASSGLMLLRAIQIVPDALLQRRFAFVRRITVDPIGGIASLGVTVGACAAGMGVWGLLLGQYALYLTQGIAAWALLRWRPRRSLVSFKTWRELAGYARHLVVAEVVRRSTGQLDSILLGRLSGPGALGQYAYGIRIATVPTDAWVSVASYVLMPAFARISDTPARFRRAFTEALAAMLTVGLPIALILLVCGGDLAFVLFGPEWARSGDAIRALAGVGVGQMLTSIASETDKAAGRPQLVTQAHVFTAIISVVILPALLIAFEDDVVGVALAISLISVLTGLYAIRAAAGAIGASLGSAARSLRGLLPATGLALVTGLMFLDLMPHDPSRPGAALAVVADVAVMSIVYAAAILVLAPADFRRLTETAGRLRRRK